MKTLYTICCLLAVGAFPGLLNAAQQVRPIQKLIQAYPKEYSYEFSEGSRHPVLHETDEAYFIKLDGDHDFIAKVAKAITADQSAAELHDGDLRFLEAHTETGTRGYLIFNTEAAYTVIDSDTENLRLEYRLGDTKLKCTVNAKYFELALPELTDPKDAICVLELSNNTAGSGFLIIIDGQLYCMTNQHVIASPGRLRIEMVNGAELDYGEIEFADDRDLARIEILSSYAPAFAHLRAPELGESITVLGNSYGAGRVTTLRGKVQGLNIDEIETSAKFVPGNSGSPILSDDNEVIGVATMIDDYAKNDRFVKGTVFEGGRRIGVRVDTPINWIPIDMGTFHSRNRLLIQTQQFIDELPAAFIAFAETEPDMPIPTRLFKDRSLKQWLQFRNTRYQAAYKAYRAEIEAGMAENRRYQYSAEMLTDMEVFERRIINDIEQCWNSMRQRLQSKQRMLKTVKPYPDTGYMEEYVGRMKLVVDAALEATYIVQEGISGIK